MSVDLLLKLIVVVSLVVFRIYWLVAEQRAYHNLPLTSKRRYRLMRIFRILEGGFYGVTLLMLAGFDPLRFTPTIFSYFAGYVIFYAGIAVALAGRMALGNNWTHMIDYQIKHEQKLVTHGIFTYIRHPMYSGFIAIFTGLFIVMASWIYVPVFFLLTTYIFSQAKKEEYLLARHFGKEYLRYIHHSKMFIPFAF